MCLLREFLFVGDFYGVIQCVYSVACQMARREYNRDARAEQGTRILGVASWASPLRGLVDFHSAFLIEFDCGTSFPINYTYVSKSSHLLVTLYVCEHVCMCGYACMRCNLKDAHSPQKENRTQLSGFVGIARFWKCNMFRKNWNRILEPEECCFFI